MLAGCSATAAGASGHTEPGGRVEPVKTTEADWKGVADAFGRAGKLSGETVEGSGVVTNASIDYPLSGGDQTNVANLLAAIKTAKGR